MKSKPKKKALLLALACLAFLIIAFTISVQVLKKKNRYVKTYFEYPSQVRSQSVKLELQRAIHLLFPPKPKASITDSVTSLKLYKASIQGANWILRMQEEGGRYNYWFNPKTNEFSPTWEDNFLRQAGTTLSLLGVFELSKDSQYLASAILNLKYLDLSLNQLNDTISYYSYNGKVKLGGVALPMLCMLKIKELTGTRIYDDQLSDLANMIILLQDKYGTGQFKSTYVYQGNYEYEKTSGWESKIYPGEAMLALTEMYKTFGDLKYKERLDWAVEFYSKRKYWKYKSFMPWTISALAEMGIHTNDKSYIDFAEKMTKKMLRQQNQSTNSNVLGSFTGLPMVFSATSLEALGDLIHACKHFDMKDEYEHYKYRALIGYRWLLYLQIDENDMKENGYSEHALGGFPTATFDLQIRIDNTQHAITALGKGYKYIDFEI